MNHIYAWQVGRESWSALRLSLIGLHGDRVVFRWLFSVVFNRLIEQKALAGCLFAGSAELLVPQGVNQFFELADALIASVDLLADVGDLCAVICNAIIERHDLFAQCGVLILKSDRYAVHGDSIQQAVSRELKRQCLVGSHA